MKFIRSKRSLSLPEPLPGGSIEKLRPYVNVKHDEEFKLLIGYLSNLFNPETPRPILISQGELGSAKSTRTRVLVALCDPSTLPLRSLPNTERDFNVCAKNNFLLAFDNVSSKFPAWLPDRFCQISTGAGVGARGLYSNFDEISYQLICSIMFNTIDDLDLRSDLLSRTIFIPTYPIPNNERITEEEFWKRFEADRPYIIGALFDVVSACLRNYDLVNLPEKTRMADFEQWIRAGDSAFDWQPGSILQAYRQNQKEAAVEMSEDDPFANTVIEFMEDKKNWSGTTADLLDALTQMYRQKKGRSKDWPDTARALTNRLRNSASFLKENNIYIDLPQKSIYDKNSKKSKRILKLMKKETENVVGSARSGMDEENPIEVTDYIEHSDFDDLTMQNTGYSDVPCDVEGFDNIELTDEYHDSNGMDRDFVLFPDDYDGFNLPDEEPDLSFSGDDKSELDFDEDEFSGKNALF
ncbi:MAG: hypothetical protein ACP5I1_13010 [Candidatus Hinthialibacter sp.]